jgi:hypothetical protein
LDSDANREVFLVAAKVAAGAMDSARAAMPAEIANVFKVTELSFSQYPVPEGTAKQVVWVPASPGDHRCRDRRRRDCGAIGTVSGHLRSAL